MNERSELLHCLALGADGKRVGKITETAPECFTVEAGHVFPRDTYVPYAEIGRVEKGQVFLREDAAYYRAGGDVDDGHWSPELARKSRHIAGGAAPDDPPVPRVPDDKHPTD